MTTRIGGGFDPAFLDDFLLKEGSLGKYEERLPLENPETFWDWDRSNRNITIDSEDWRVHHKTGYPLAFYHNQKYVFGIRHQIPGSTKVDFENSDTVWARILGRRLIVERDDYPRFQTGELTKLSHTPKPTSLDNVFSLGNGYSIACTRRASPVEYGIRTTDGAWWMIGPSSEEEEISRRVLTLKIYDGPYRFQSRGTDIRLSDPVPISEKAEYVIYSYDDEGLKGSYSQSYGGVAPQKKAITIREEELRDRAISKEGRIGFKEGQLTGPGRVVYDLPLNATKLLDVHLRGSEVEMRIKPDDEEWTILKEYDGKAVSRLQLEITIYNSLASIRIEWESLKDWQPVGRPRIDIIRPLLGGREPNSPGNANKVLIRGTEGEGLGQHIDLYTGSYTASADVRCIRGEAIISVGGLGVVSWQPVDKTIRGAGDFTANRGDYALVLTGRGGTFSYEIDKFLVAEAGEKDWIEKDIDWWIETESGNRHMMGDSINVPELPVSLGESRRWRIGIEVPDNIGRLEEIAVSGIKNRVYNTSDSQFISHVRWSGSGKSRIHFPENLVRPPVPTLWIEADGTGATTWESTSNESPDDVTILLEGSRLSFSDEDNTYRPITLSNLLWRVKIQEEKAEIFYSGRLVGTMYGRGLPLRVIQDNPEDVQIDSSEGFIQLRRGLGPRFQGWEIGRVLSPNATRGSLFVFGADEEEARENLPFYKVNSGR